MAFSDAAFAAATHHVQVIESRTCKNSAVKIASQFHQRWCAFAGVLGIANCPSMVAPRMVPLKNLQPSAKRRRRKSIHYS